jgi:rubredoxin
MPNRLFAGLRRLTTTGQLHKARRPTKRPARLIPPGRSPEKSETMTWNIVARKVHRLRCPECEHIYTEDEAMQLWQCSREDCQETFVDDDLECPCCGSPSSRRLADFGCEDCLEELEEIRDTRRPTAEG